MSKVRLATVWLDGCSGCHMSFLDMDERILEIADRVEVVYSPLVDPKEFPAEVDVTIVEGARLQRGGPPQDPDGEGPDEAPRRPRRLRRHQQRARRCGTRSRSKRC